MVLPPEHPGGVAELDLVMAIENGIARQGGVLDRTFQKDCLIGHRSGEAQGLQ